MTIWSLDSSGNYITDLTYSPITANFGFSCSICSVNNIYLYAIVGSAKVPGAAYIYFKDISTGTSEKGWKLDSSGNYISDISGTPLTSFYGSSCSICSVNNTYLYAIVGLRSGCAAYIYFKDITSGTTAKGWKLDSSGNYISDISGSPITTYYGQSCSICSINNTYLYAIVTAYTLPQGGASGAAYIYFKDISMSTTAKGWKLDSSGNYISDVSGSPIIDSYGTSCSICSVNNTYLYAIVGVAAAYQAGAAYIYFKDITSGTTAKGWKLDSSGNYISDVSGSPITTYYGYSCSICSVNNIYLYAIVGVYPNAGGAYIYFKNISTDRTEKRWSLDSSGNYISDISGGPLTSIYGQSCSICSVNNIYLYAIVGIRATSGAAYIYFKDISASTTAKGWKLDSSGNYISDVSGSPIISQYGFSCSICSINNKYLYAIVGANSTPLGGAYIYTTLDLVTFANYTPVIYTSVSFYLPPVAESTNATYFIKKVGSAAVLISSYNKQCKIDTSTIYTMYSAVILSCDGTQWWILSTYGDANSPLLTDTGAGSTTNIVNASVFITSTQTIVQLLPPDGSIQIIAKGNYPSSSSIKIIAPSPSKIDGFSSITLTSSGNNTVGCILSSNESNWYILSYFIGTNYTQGTATLGTSGTNMFQLGNNSTTTTPFYRPIIYYNYSTNPTFISCTPLLSSPTNPTLTYVYQNDLPLYTSELKFAKNKNITPVVTNYCLPCFASSKMNYYNLNGSSAASNTSIIVIIASTQILLPNFFLILGRYN